MTGTNEFTEHELALLAAVCDTLIPSISTEDDPFGLFKRSASDLNIPQQIVDLMNAIADSTTRLSLRFFLQMLGQPLVNLAWGGQTKSFLRMNLDERTVVLRDWADSTNPLRRRAFYALKRVALFLFYTLADESGRNPNWAAFNYPGAPGPDPKAAFKNLTPMRILADSVLETDVVVIGSGAGGGVVAAELAAAGLDVLVLEKGGYYSEPDFDGDEASAQARMFEQRGFLTTADLSMVILAGATLGGGTTINWAASLRTPDYVTREWEKEYGVSGFSGPSWEKALDKVSARINVNTGHSQANARNAVLERGAQALGYGVQPIPLNVKNCGDCGFCGFGCRLGAKQSTLRTFLQDAAEHGARVAVRAHVDKILIERGSIRGVLATLRVPNRPPIQLIVKARAVVVAAGALHTPAILLRSGLGNAHIGQNLHLHPSSASIGLYDAPIRSWEGVMMSHYIPQFNNLDGKGYGVTLESAPAHPGLTGLSLAWESGKSHKDLMARYDHMANILVITRDFDGGSITVNKHGEPVIHYTLSDLDRAHLLTGLVESLRIHKAAGARAVYGPMPEPGLHSITSDSAFVAYLGQVKSVGLRLNAFVLGSAHQMSSCRMGGSPARGALKPTGETFEVKNLFVADASALPTATGVNPMLSIMGVAYQIAQHIKHKLGE